MFENAAPFETIKSQVQNVLSCYPPDIRLICNLFLNCRYETSLRFDVGFEFYLRPGVFISAGKLDLGKYGVLYVHLFFSLRMNTDSSNHDFSS
jgi:hypothetical protein